MSAPEASGTANHPSFDTLIIEPVPPITGSGGHPDRLSVVTTPDGDGGEVVEVRVRKRFTELDGLRGAAALLVVVFHLRKYIRDLDPPRHLDLLIGGGYLMVDLFFVLSGFVLARSMLATRTGSDVARFSSLRARRFLPLHVTGMAIAFACVLITLAAQHYGFENAPHRPAFTVEQESPWGYLSALLLLQGFIGPHFAGYAAAWSLSIELWTNVLLVVAIAAVPWPNRKQWVGPAAVLAGLFLLFVLSPDGQNSIGWTAAGRGLTGLGTGMTIYWIYTVMLHRAAVREAARETGPGTPSRLLSSWPAVGAVVGLLGLIACMHWSKDIRHLQFVPILPISALLILSLVHPSRGPVHRLMNSGVVQWLGSRSFALYALHASVLTAVALACRLRGLDLHNPKVAVFIIVTTLIGSLAAAEVGHRFIERLLVPKKSG